MTRSKFRSAGWLATAGLVTAALIAPAGAAATGGPLVEPTQVGGHQNPENITACPEGYGTTIALGDESGSNSAGNVEVEMTYDGTSKTVSFTVTGGVVLHAFIKGGPAYNWYDYTGLGGVTADSNLVAPDNQSEGPAGLSHAVFCVAEVEESEQPSEEPSEQPSEEPSEQPTESPEGSVEAETGTPSTTLPPTDGLTTSAPTGSSWQLLLVAMAGVLAAALLLTPAAKKNR